MEFDIFPEMAGSFSLNYIDALANASDKSHSDYNYNYILHCVKKDYAAFKYLSHDLRDDFNIASFVVHKNGFFSKYLSDNLKNNKEIALISTSQSGRSLKFFSDEIKNDKHIVMNAFEKNPESFTSSSFSIKNDIEFVHSLIKTDGRILAYCQHLLPNSLLEDAAKNSAFPYDIEQWSNPYFIIDVVKKEFNDIQYASKALFNDFDFLTLFFQKFPNGLRRMIRLETIFDYKIAPDWLVKKSKELQTTNFDFILRSIQMSNSLDVLSCKETKISKI